jgi:hypothetical protein
LRHAEKGKKTQKIDKKAKNCAILLLRPKGGQKEGNKVNTVDTNSILALNLVTRDEYIEQLNSNIENWKALQVEQAHSASDIRYYAELVYEARAELERMGA